MIFLWGFWTAFAAYGAWSLRQQRQRGYSALFLAWAALGAGLFVLAALDNSNMRVYDCRPGIDPRTGADALSCAVDHWLPEPFWFVINP